jgi:hypothetical protein
MVTITGNREQKCCGQYNTELPFTDITFMSPSRRRNGDMPVGYTVLWREQCKIMAESQNSLTRRGGHC